MITLIIVLNCIEKPLKMKETFTKKFNQLPKNKQQQVIDYIEFLLSKTQKDAVPVEKQPLLKENPAARIVITPVFLDKEKKVSLNAKQIKDITN